MEYSERAKIIPRYSWKYREYEIKLGYETIFVYKDDIEIVCRYPLSELTIDGMYGYLKSYVDIPEDTLMSICEIIFAVVNISNYWSDL